MPTGYTSKLYDGKPQAFAEFALACARNFGALVSMRDSGMDATIPDTIEPSTYHKDGAIEAEAKIAKVEQMTATELMEDQESKRADAEKYRSETLAKVAARKGRYQWMLKQVTDWAPPTPEHHGLKTFMIDQLSESMRFDCDGWEPSVPVIIDPEAYRQKLLANLREGLAYNLKHHAEEVARSSDRTAWIQQLRSSLMGWRPAAPATADRNDD